MLIGVNVSHCVGSQWGNQYAFLLLYLLDLYHFHPFFYNQLSLITLQLARQTISGLTSTPLNKLTNSDSFSVYTSGDIVFQFIHLNWCCLLCQDFHLSWHLQTLHLDYFISFQSLIMNPLNTSISNWDFLKFILALQLLFALWDIAGCLWHFFWWCYPHI